MSRHWLLNDTPYPAKPRLSRSDELTVLRTGPLPHWFRPFAEHANVAPRLSAHPWGYVHIHGEWGEPPVWELVGHWSPMNLHIGLEIVFKQHDWHVLDVNGYLNDHECHGVFYWLPGDPRDLPLSVGVTR